MKSISPLRYPGGKSVLYSYIANVIEINRMQNYTYVELFAGGAGLAVALLLNGKVKNIIINDFDFCIYAFWHSVLYETEALCTLIEQTDVTIEQRDIQKRIYDNHANASILQIGFATLFLNRTNRSGILCGGVIGGKKQEGQYKLDCRFNKKDIINRIRRVATKRDHIRLFNMDAAEFLQTQDTILRGRCFFYLDPPYVVKGGDLYENAFQESDHEHLSRVVRSRLYHRKWIMTYDRVPLIETLYQRLTTQPYDLSYTAQDKKQGTEIMIFSKNLAIPGREIIQR